jgi:molecular chaperone GrpE
MRKDKENINKDNEKIEMENINKDNEKNKQDNHDCNENCKHEENVPNDIMNELEFLNNKFEEKIKEYEEKVLYLRKENLANLDNQKKQFEKEKEELKKYLFQKFFEDILIVLDSLEVGINAKQDNYEKFLNGLKMTKDIFIKTLNKYNVSIIPAETGDTFNDAYHECMGTSEDFENNKIMDILSTGYKYSDRVIRPTKVIVGVK